ncbi:MAG TPA: hypothetical protein VFU16_04270 [Solirubrobacterales bacterium]|nr:hypothetical protein [Solirubrobacterales bacterium]
MLAVCGGGSNATAIVVILAAILIWLLVAYLVIRTGRDRDEQVLLVALLVISVLLGGGVFFGVQEGFSGSGDDLGKFVLSLLIAGAVGAGIALVIRGRGAVRAFVISSWGALFLTGGIYVLFIAFLGFGTGCLS